MVDKPPCKSTSNDVCSTTVNTSKETSVENIHLTTEPDNNVNIQATGNTNKIHATESLTNEVMLTESALKNVDLTEAVMEEKKAAKDDIKTNCRPNKNVKKETFPFRKPRKLDGTEILVAVAKQVIVDGAAVFFPDKEARRKQLFSMMGNVEVNGDGGMKMVEPGQYYVFIRD